MFVNFNLLYKGTLMQLSTRTRYGTRAIIEIARNYEGPPIKRKEIAGSQRIPDSYLENILVTLKAGGLIQTTRGANGGYRLTRNPSAVSMLEIVVILEGHLTPVPCLETEKCELINDCTTRSIWDEMYHAMEKVLSSYTLEDIIAKEKERIPFSYTI